MSTSTWTGAVNSDWDDAGNWSPTDVPGAGSDVVIAAGAPVAVASASIGTVNSITDSSDLSFESAGTNTVTTFLDNTGHLRVDDSAGAGGTSLNIGGTLTNSHRLTIGNATLSAPDEVTAAALDNKGSIYLTGSSANQALLDVSGSAGFGTAEVLSGYVRLVGDSAIEFASGPITSLANRAHLGLNGTDAFIEDSKALGSNSALTGLASISAGATLTLHDGPAVSTTGALANDGNVYLDDLRGNGGSSLTLAGALTNSGSLFIGNAKLSAPDTVTAASVDNTAFIHLTGSGANQALLDVAGSAGFGTTGVLSGAVQLAGDSAIEFASAQITSLAASAHLVLDGNDAFIEDSTAPGSNSALIGLASIGSRASFALDNGASVSTTGALDNHGGSLFVGSDESNLTVGGALTNSGNLTMGHTSQVSTTALTNTGSIDVGIGGVRKNKGPNLLDVAGSAGFGTAGTLTGFVELYPDSAIEFTSGQIATIAASSTLFLDGNNAFVEDSTALGSNSALTGLSNVVGALTLYNGAALSTTGALTNTGSLSLGSVDPNRGETSLTVGGTLTNTGTLDMSPYDCSVTANSFVNSGTADMSGVFNVSGATTNNGSISIGGIITDVLAGAVGGAGSFSLQIANLQFDSSVSSGQTITESDADALTLEQAQSFAATISGFGTGDTIDATNFVETGTKYNFVENSAMTGGTLTLTDTSLSLTANILMTGDYSNSSFRLAHDSGTGTLVKFV
jgi:hypothetical protein